MNIRTKLLFTFLLLAATASAQFIDVDWNAAKSDSVLPVCTATQTLPADYAAYDYSASIEYPEYRLMNDEEISRYNLLQRQEEFRAWPVIETNIAIAAKVPMLDISFLPVVVIDGKFLRIDSYKLVVNRTPLSTLRKAAGTGTANTRYAENSVLANGKWVKIGVSESGIHQITNAELSNMGFTVPSKVRLYGYGGNQLPKKNIHTLTDDLCEIPLWRETNRILFYANGPISWSYESGRYTHTQNVYSQRGYYFLTESDDEPMAFPTEKQTSYSATYTTFPDYTLYENDALSLCKYGNILLDNYNFAQGRTKSHQFSMPDIAGTDMTVDISFGSSAEVASSVTISVNDEQAGTLSVPKASSNELGKIVSGKYNSTATKANTTIKLTHNVTNSNTTGYLDYLRLNFKRTLKLRDSQTNFRGSSTTSGNAKFIISGASGSTRVWCVTSPDAIGQIEGELDGTTYSVIASGLYSEEYVAFDTNGTFPSVSIAGNVPNQNLHALGQTDLVIIVPSSGIFLEAAQRLADAHAYYDGITTAVVTAEQVYNEFSSGTPDATAYRRLMKMLYDRASDATDAPKYLLLFGDGVSDNRMLTYTNRNPEDYLLCHESENSVNAVYSYVLEDYYGYLDDSEGSSPTRDKTDIGVGRIPATSISEANGVVDKLIAYMKNDEAGAWQNIISLWGDDGDKDIPNQHMIDAEKVAGIVEENNPAYIIERIYWDNYEPVASSTGKSYPLVTEAIKTRLDEGALVVNYSGHGSSNTMSHEMVWFAADMQALTSPRLPFWITASCDIGPFDIGDNSLGEAAILNPTGGAVGIFTTTRTVLQKYNSVINCALMEVLLDAADDSGRKLAVGDAIRLAKNNVITHSSDLSENKLQFVLLGDPALRLKLPDYSFVVERVNGEEQPETTNASEGGKLTIEGYVSQGNGSVATDFTGVLTSTLYDSAEEFNTRDNSGLGVFTYTAYDKKLFSGTDSVKNGRFSITMPIPLDISYSGDEGMLSLFAVDSAKTSTAQGRYDKLIMAGTASSGTDDGTGPEITAYLNTPAFRDGDEVNATPCLFAEFYDENGINTVGNGVGHDIMLIIDNDADYTYNLNSVYTSVVGDYKRGTVEFSIDELPAGEHTLLLRAWDLFNNSSVAELSFVVVPNLAPQFTSLTLSPNPVQAGETAIFSLTHDFPGSALDVTIEVFDFQGRVLWKNTEQSTSSGETYTYEWNVTAQGGQPMPTGIYLYRASIASGESCEVTKTGKFIVINNK